MKSISKIILPLILFTLLGCKNNKPNPALASIDLKRGEL